MIREVPIGNKKLVKLSYYRRQPYINFREYVISKEGTFIPTKKGILLTPAEWRNLKSAVEDINNAVTTLLPTIDNSSVSTHPATDNRLTSQPVSTPTNVENPSKTVATQTVSTAALFSVKTPSKRPSLSLDMQQPLKKRGRPCKEELRH